MNDEIWREHFRDVRLLVSNYGRMRHADKILKPFVNNERGLLYCRLYSESVLQVFRIDIAVAMAFLPQPMKQHLLHIDGNIENNKAENLAWTHEKGPATSQAVTSGRKRQVKCLETGEIFPSVNAAAASVGRTASAIVGACRGRFYTVGKKRWKYLEGP